VIKDDSQIRELQQVLARQYLRLEQLRIHRNELAPETFAANEAAKLVGGALRNIRQMEARRDELRRQAGLLMLN
jgi:hypothetical protein